MSLLLHFLVIFACLISSSYLQSINPPFLLKDAVKKFDQVRVFYNLGQYRLIRCYYVMNTFIKVTP